MSQLVSEYLLEWGPDQRGISIGSNSIVGMGSVVYNDIPDGVIALGNPARVARPNQIKKFLRFGE